MKINLLPQEYRPSGKIQKLARALNRTSVGILGLYILALIALFGGLFFLSNTRAKLEDENQQLANRIEALKTREGILLSLRDRARLAREVFAQAAGAEELVQDVVEGLPAEVAISEISADRQALVVVARAPDSTALAASLEQLKKSQFSQVVLNSLSQTNQGGYVFSLQIK